MHMCSKCFPSWTANIVTSPASLIGMLSTCQHCKVWVEQFGTKVSYKYLEGVSDLETAIYFYMKTVIICNIFRVQLGSPIEILKAALQIRITRRRQVRGLSRIANNSFVCVVFFILYGLFIWIKSFYSHRLLRRSLSALLYKIKGILY